MSGDSQQNTGSNFKNVIKIGIILILGLILFIYSIILFTGEVGKDTSKHIKKSTDPQEIKIANETIKKNLTNNKYIHEYQEKEKYLEIKVYGKLWRKINIKEKKTFIKELANARSTIGKNPAIRVIDYKSLIEYASYENNRVNLAELDF